MTPVEQETYIADSLNLLTEAMQRLEVISAGSIRFTSTELELRIRQHLSKVFKELPPKLEY